MIKRSAVLGISTMDDLLAGTPRNADSFVQHMIVPTVADINTAWIGIEYQTVLDSLPENFILRLHGINDLALTINAESTFLTKLNVSSCVLKKININSAVFGAALNIRSSEIEALNANQTFALQKRSSSIQTTGISVNGGSKFTTFRLGCLGAQFFSTSDTDFIHRLSIEESSFSEITFSGNTRIGGLTIQRCNSRFFADFESVAVNPTPNGLRVPMEYIFAIRELQKNW